MPESTPATILQFAPTLPVELVDEILRIATPSKHQLARICLISKQFLWPARKLLYDSLELLYVPMKRYDTEMRRRTFRILRTLENNADIRQLPSKISFNLTQNGKYDTDGPIQRENTVIRRVLSLTPKVDSISLDQYFSLSASIISSGIGARKMVTSLTLAFLSSEKLGFIDRLGFFPQLQNIRKLRILDRVEGTIWWDDWPVLPDLEALDLPNRSNLDPSSLSERLTVLRISLNSETTIDFSLLPNLKSLWLRLPYDRLERLSEPKFDKLLHLQDLYLDRFGAADEQLPCGLLANLVATPPPRRICLIFPRVVPAIALIQYLDSFDDFVAFEIRIPAHNYVTTSSLAALRTRCKNQGIKLSFMATYFVDVLRL